MMQSFVDRFNGIIAASYLAERILYGVEVGYSEERITKMLEDNFEEMEALFLAGERFSTAEYLAEIQYAFGVETDICEMGRILLEYCEFQKSVLLSKTLFGVQDMFRARGWKRFSNLKIDRKTLYPLALLYVDLIEASVSQGGGLDEWDLCQLTAVSEFFGIDFSFQLQRTIDFFGGPNMRGSIEETAASWGVAWAN